MAQGIPETINNEDGLHDDLHDQLPVTDRSHLRPDSPTQLQPGLPQLLFPGPHSSDPDWSMDSKAGKAGFGLSWAILSTRKNKKIQAP